MTKKPASIAPEATAAIDRAIATLQVLKTHLKAKKLKGRALAEFLSIAMDELRELQVPFEDLRSQEIDEAIAHYRRLSDQAEEP